MGHAEDAGDVNDGEVVLVRAADLDLKDVVGENGTAAGGIVDVEADAKVGVYLWALVLS
ncbi:hypothetical protein IMZ48_14800, partial [Candidatus Bathyarchaeota archaeon]|nr:hypothetical protein [Candidatus Bathyarchaeota archaeon]